MSILYLQCHMFCIVFWSVMYTFNVPDDIFRVSCGKSALWTVLVLDFGVNIFDVLNQPRMSIGCKFAERTSIIFYFVVNYPNVLIQKFTITCGKRALWTFLLLNLRENRSCVVFEIHFLDVQVQVSRRICDKSALWTFLFLNWFWRIFFCVAKFRYFGYKFLFLGLFLKLSMCYILKSRLKIILWTYWPDWYAPTKLLLK